MSVTSQTAAPQRSLRVLIVEDREDDLFLLLRELERCGYSVAHRRVDTVQALRSALTTEDWELVVSDFSLPAMTAHDVLHTLRSVRPDLPCIVMSSTIGEEVAVDVLRSGARDFVVKERMARLVPAIERELREAAERRRLRAAEVTLQETRERMQFVLEAVGIGLWEWDIETGQVIWSEVQERLHGLQPGTFGRTLHAFVAAVHPDDRPEMMGRIEEARRERHDSRAEYRTNWADGSVHWLVSIGRTLVDGDGRPTREVGITIDVTAQRALEEQFRQAQKMESIGNLAGGIAHDFNNLLTVISGCCDLAAGRLSADSDAIESIESIRSAAVSASGLTRQLLTFSRRQIVVPKVLDLNEVITGFGNILRRLVEENVHIDFRLGTRLPPVRVDPGQVEQVLLNLLANARDAMPDGGTVTIQTCHVTIEERDSVPQPAVPPGEYVALSVADTGSGMSAEVQVRLFEPFFTTKPIGRGTGLGLATVYGIVQQSDGYIVVESELGSGTTFTVYLPVAAESIEPPRVDEKQRSDDLTGTETILVVEDNAPLRRLNERILQRYGYRVLIAADGAHAQQICVEYKAPIDVVLMDIIMPGDSGPAIAEWISERRPETKIIYMSGYAGDAISRRGVLIAGSAFLQKPFDATQLARAVRDVLSSRP